MKTRGILINLMAMLMLAMPALAAVVTTATVPATRSSGDVITASIWNSDALGIYTYLNNNIVAALNVLTTKGDLYVYNGAALVRQAIGADNTVLTADSAQATGIKWAALANTVALTTKGDVLGYSTAAARIPVGANGTVLTADSTAALGVAWGVPTTAIPKGSIVAWSPAGAGTSTIPSGWALCDGSTVSGVVTPNLIGRFIIGTRPAASAATASVGGYGALTVDANGTGAITHSHTVTVSGTSGVNSTSATVASGAGQAVSANGHTHSLSASGTSSAASTEPADYALVYIEKL